jgi:hypothetical protein
MKITKRQLRRIIREAAIQEYGITGRSTVLGRDWIDAVMEELADGEIELAASYVLDSYMMDDTWSKEEEALEDMLAALGPNPSVEAVDSVAKEWYTGYKAGDYRPAEEEHEADWKRGADRSRARSAKRQSRRRLS